MLLLKFVLSRAISDVPDWVVEQRAKSEFKRRELIRGVSLDFPHNDSSPK